MDNVEERINAISEKIISECLVDVDAVEILRTAATALSIAAADFIEKKPNKEEKSLKKSLMIT